MLLFKKRFLEAIRAGRKTQTIRIWPCRRMKSGQRSYIPGVGRIHVVSVAAISLAELTECDARLDGFSSLAALRTELADLYGAELPTGYQAYRIRFEVAPEDES